MARLGARWVCPERRSGQGSGSMGVSGEGVWPGWWPDGCAWRGGLASCPRCPLALLGPSAADRASSALSVQEWSLLGVWFQHFRGLGSALHVNVQSRRPLCSHWGGTVLQLKVNPSEDAAPVMLDFSRSCSDQAGDLGNLELVC